MFGISHNQLLAEFSVVIVFFTFVVMQWFGKLPTVKSIQELAAVINSRGGNIMVLAGFSILFFTAAIRFTYWFMEKAAEGKISPQDALGLAAFTWVTGTAFGGAFTSMVKAMTGENMVTEAQPQPRINRDIEIEKPSVPQATSNPT